MLSKPLLRSALRLLVFTCLFSAIVGAQAEPSSQALMRQPDSRAFTLTEPNFILGGDGNASCDNCATESESLNQIRFRVALRYRLAGSTDDKSQSGLYFTYRQNSFWHFYEESAPFFDNNYSPGAMGYFEFNRTSPYSPALRVFIQHESNGRDGIASRSWNQMGGGIDLGDPERSHWYGIATIWYPFKVADQNLNLPDLAGRGEIKVYFQPWIKSDYRLDQRGISLAVRTLGKQALSNVEAAAYWRPGRPSAGVDQPRFTPSLMLQVFHGYAENLLTFQERRTVARIGVAFIR